MIIKDSFISFNTSKLTILNPKKIQFIILHHRCGNGDVVSIHEQHKRQGWAGIGYHFYIRKDGIIYTGRPTKYVGSHCKGNNSCSLGICLEGDFRKEKPTKEQIKALKELVKDLKSEFPTIRKVMHHSELYPTACPVVNLKKMIGEV